MWSQGKGTHPDSVGCESCLALLFSLSNKFTLKRKFISYNNYHIWSMVGTHIIHIPSTLDVTTLCLCVLVLHYHSIILFNPFMISLKLYTLQLFLLDISLSGDSHTVHKVLRLWMTLGHAISQGLSLMQHQGMKLRNYSFLDSDSEACAVL